MTSEINIKEKSSSKIGKFSHIKKEENSEGEAKEIYFIILYPRKQQEKPEEFAFSEKDINLVNIYTDEVIQEDGRYLYKKVFKFNGRANKKYTFEFYIGKDIYNIYFEVKENSFIYEVYLKQKTYIYIPCSTPSFIDQKIIEYHKKLYIFLEALEKNNENIKKDILYEETINLFEKKKGFSLLISLFVLIYKNKDLCPLLTEIFKEMNFREKDNEKNMDRNKELEQYIKTFRDISSESDNLIDSNGYEPLEFYGIIFCYLNYYDKDNFHKLLEKLYKEKWEVLYEILLIYFLHFINPINQDLDFFVKFIDYCTSKKDFGNFEIGLNYINDIETFITAIDKIKEKIFDKYVISIISFKPIKFKSNLELIKQKRNQEIKAIIDGIKSINNFSKEKKVLLIYFTSNFWIKILKEYNIPDDVNIKNCYNLREIFVEYNDLVNELYEKEKNSVIKKDINRYFERDEFAFVLDKNIEKMLHNNTELTNSEILGFFEVFNPYYKEEKYQNRRSTYLFDLINLEDCNEEFIRTFKMLNFEIMFKDNESEFLNKMISKIKSISNFGTILELIDIKKLSKINEFIGMLKDKYEQVIKWQIESLTDKELNEAVRILAKLVGLIYMHEKNCTFIQKKIDELDKKINSLIYIQLMRTSKGGEYKILKEFIFSKFLNNINVDDIIDLIDTLEKEDKTIFFEELMKKCHFSKDEYYSNNENEKIALLCELNDKEKLKIEDEEKNFWGFEKILQQIYKDLEGEIKIKILEEFLENEEEQVIKRLGLIKITLVKFEPQKKI